MTDKSWIISFSLAEKIFVLQIFVEMWLHHYSLEMYQKMQSPHVKVIVCTSFMSIIWWLTSCLGVNLLFCGEFFWYIGAKERNNTSEYLRECVKIANPVMKNVVNKCVIQICLHCTSCVVLVLVFCKRWVCGMVTTIWTPVITVLMMGKMPLWNPSVKSHWGNMAAKNYLNWFPAVIATVTEIPINNF